MVALFSANRWRLDVLTFLIKGFGLQITYLRLEAVGIWLFPNGAMFKYLTKSDDLQSYDILDRF